MFFRLFQVSWNIYSLEDGVFDAMAFLNVVRLGLQAQINFTNKLGYSYKFIQAEICFNLHLVIFR